MHGGGLYSPAPPKRAKVKAAIEKQRRRRGQRLSQTIMPHLRSNCVLYGSHAPSHANREFQNRMIQWLEPPDSGNPASLANTARCPACVPNSFVFTLPLLQL